MRKVCHLLRLCNVVSVLLAILIAKVHCNCLLGVLKPASSWAVTNRHIVYSIVPGIIPPQDKTTQTTVPARASEGLLYAEVRPPAAPAKQSSVCLRSMSSVSAACNAGKVELPADSLAPIDPESFLFNVTEGFPQGPCIPLDASGTAAQLKHYRPRPDECWPGAGYCTDSSTEWTLASSASVGKQLITLSIARTISTYQDTDGSTDSTNSTISFEVTDGCVLQNAAAAAAPAHNSCLGCNGKRVAVQSISHSTSCVHCPMRSSKAREPMALVPGSSSWKCIPGMPKGFESIAVRMGSGGNPQCASANGKTCLRNIGKAVTCQAMALLLNKLPATGTNRQSAGVINTRITAEAGVAVMKPLTCGAAHAAVWAGVTGYNVPRHWCIVARNWLQDRQASVQGRCVMQP